MLSFVIFLLIVILFFNLLRKPNEELHSHWSKLLPNFRFSTKRFYELVIAEMKNHEINNLSFEKVQLKTGNVFSGERLYLRVRWGEFYYDLCFAPFGDGCFVSWWLIFETSETEILISKIPFIGGWLRYAFFRPTYYKVDTASMFMTYAHNSVLTIVDEITKDTGIRISEDERKPILRDIFHR